jgi:hypothetical protein
MQNTVMKKNKCLILFFFKLYQLNFLLNTSFTARSVPLAANEVAACRSGGVHCRSDESKRLQSETKFRTRQARHFGKLLVGCCRIGRQLFEKLKLIAKLQN